jgi:hypothetical protein
VIAVAPVINAKRREGLDIGLNSGPCAESEPAIVTAIGVMAALLADPIFLRIFWRIPWRRL